MCVIISDVWLSDVEGGVGERWGEREVAVVKGGAGEKSLLFYTSINPALLLNIPLCLTPLFSFFPSDIN